MQRLEEEFLETIVGDSLSGHKQTDKLIFKLRFDPKFHDKSGAEPQTNDQIYSKVTKDLSIEKPPTGKNLQRIIKALVDKFEAQMKKDEVDVDFLKSGEREGGGKWPKVYNWLWNHYYPRWFLEKQWQELVDKADKTDDWLQVKEVTSVERDWKKFQVPQPTIPLGAEINLIVNWSGESRYLLLLNQGTSGNKFCFCPSKLFAPSNQLFQQQMHLPQHEVKNHLCFEDVGKEHFLGIVMEQPLDLAWLRPNGQEDVPALDAGRLKELVEKLQQQGNCQLFYKFFEVV